jgi:enoyl-CoA hydratase/carnithine racemase
MCGALHALLRPPTRAMASAAPPAAAAAAGAVRAERRGALAVAVLDRPAALNALTASMVARLYELLSEWDADPGVAAILVRGGGGRALCAGGDVKALVAAGRAGDRGAGAAFFRAEYRLDFLIARLRTPYVALMDGITMGGGVGLAAHGAFRVATENTLLAMPECAIGLAPDVGASHALPRLGPGLGLWLGLTGARLTGADARRAGLATHYLPSEMVPELEAALAALGAGARGEAVVRRALNALEDRAGAPPPGALDAARLHIAAAFGDAQPSVAAVAAACAARGAWGAAALEQLAAGSPTSLRLTFALFRRGAAQPLEECLAQELRAAARLAADPASDFYEGVTALLVEKRPPRWRRAGAAAPGAPDAAADAAVARLLAPLPPGEELQLAGVGQRPGGAGGGSRL